MIIGTRLKMNCMSFSIQFNPDYGHMCEYINEAEVDFIVQDKSIEYYDEKEDIYYSLTYKIDECGTYPIYENDDYALYMFER